MQCSRREPNPQWGIISSDTAFLGRALQIGEGECGRAPDHSKGDMWRDEKPPSLFLRTRTNGIRSGVLLRTVGITTGVGRVSSVFKECDFGAGMESEVYPKALTLPFDTLGGTSLRREVDASLYSWTSRKQDS